MMIWLGLFALTLVAALFIGRVYCGYACPMNTLMIPTGWISKKFKLQANHTPSWLQSKKLPWLTLIASVVVVIITQKVFHKNLPILPIWFATSIIITLRYKPTVFHNFICPFGPIQKLFGQFAILSKKANCKTCIGCKLCEKVCPSNTILVNKDDKKSEINTSLCFQCSSCQQVCPKDAIQYRNIKFNKLK